MFKLKKFFLIVVFYLLFLPITGKAQNNQVDLYFFEGQGCPYCAKMKSYLEGLKVDYPNLKVYEFEVYFNKENQVLFEKMARAYGAETSGVPTIFVDDEVINGADFEKVKNAIERCSKETCISPIDKIKNLETDSNVNISVDGYSPATNKTAEIVGWIVIGVVVLVGVCLTIYFLKKKGDARL